MDLNTSIKTALKDPRVLSLVEELVPNIYKYRELKLFWNKPLKFILGKGKYVNIDNNRIKKLVEDIIQAEIPNTTKKYKIKNIKQLSLNPIKIKTFLSYNETAIPLSIIASQKGTNYVFKQAANEYISLVWDSTNPDHQLNYENHFISWKNLIIDNININSEKEFVDAIISCLQKKHFVYLFLNECNIETSRRHNINFDHDYCITGYNLQTNKFNIMGYAKKNFIFFEENIDIIKQAFFSQVNSSPFIISLKAKKVFRSKNKKQIMKDLYEYFSFKNANKGLNIYTKLFNELDNNYIDYRYFSIIKDHSYLIKQIIDKYISIQLGTYYNLKVCTIANQIFTYCLLLREKLNESPKHIIEVRKYLQILFDNEIEFMNKLYNLKPTNKLK